MNQNENDSILVSKKFDLRKYIGLIIDYLIEVLKYSWLIFIAAFIFGKFMRDRKLDDPTIYTGDFSFKFNELNTEKQQNISSLFGFNQSISSASESNSNLSKLKEIIFTRKIFTNVLFHRIDFKSDSILTNDFIINHYLRNFYYHTDSDANYFFTTDSTNPYDRKANYLLKYVHNSIVRNHLILDPVGSLIHIKAKSSSENFSYELVGALFQELEKYYNNSAIDKKRRFYEMSQKRTNELRGQLSFAEENYINYVNSNSAEAGGRNNSLIKTQKLSTELRKATESYFSALSTTDAAEVDYKSQLQTTTFTIIDPPLFPLSVHRPNPYLHMVLGAVLGGGFIFVLVIGRKIFKDYFILKDDDEVIIKEEPKEID
jgi:hypothetical protein